MTGSVQLVLVVLVALTAITVIRLVRRRHLRGKYVLLWLGTCAVCVPVVLVPDRLDSLVRRAGVDYPPTAYLLAAVVFLLAVAIHMSWELSRIDERTRTLAEELALLRAEVELPGQPGPPADEPG